MACVWIESKVSVNPKALPNPLLLASSIVHSHRPKQWSQIASKMNDRTGKQCRERWHNHLGPGIKKEAWTADEEIKLVRAHAELGNSWVEIAKRIPGRPENSIKNHWNAVVRRQKSRRSRKKTSAKRNDGLQSSVLQDYVRSTFKVTEEGVEKIIKDAEETQGNAVTNAPPAMLEQGESPHMEKNNNSAEKNDIHPNEGTEGNNFWNASPLLGPTAFPFMEKNGGGNDEIFEESELFHLLSSPPSYCGFGSAWEGQYPSLEFKNSQFNRNE